MPKSSNLTPAQAAAVLAISASTLRRWAADYAEHLSLEARGAKGRHRTYAPSDMAILARAGELLKTHPPSEVNQLLGLADDVQQSATLASLPAIGQELQAARDVISRLNARLEAQEAEIERLRGEVGSLFERQRKTRDKHQAEIDELRATLAMLAVHRSWWARLRGR